MPPNPLLTWLDPELLPVLMGSLGGRREICRARERENGKTGSGNSKAVKVSR